MLARDVMMTNILSVSPDQDVCEALDMMRKHHFRMLPVVDADERLVGALTTNSILYHLLPDYILSGNLGDVAYAPDIGVLAAHYPDIVCKHVSKVMDKKPLVVQEDEALLGVASTLVTDKRHHVYTLVIDKGRHLLGIISPGDIIDHFRKLHLENEK